MDLQYKKNKTVQLIIFTLTIVLFTIVGFFVGSVFFPNSNLKGSSALGINSAEFAKYTQILSTIDNKFYYRDRLQNSKLQDSTIKGLVSGLNDSPTRYLNTDEYSQYKQTIAGNIFGVGIEIGDDQTGTRIFSVYPSSPAEKAGLLKDDKFLVINDKDVSKYTASEIASLIRGPEGSTVKLTIQRKDGKLDFQIVRAKVHTDSITFSKLDPSNFIGICNIKITRFTDDSVDTWKKNWNVAVAQFLSNGCKKLAIDLRHDGGGYVDASQYAIEEFIPDGRNIYGQKDNSGQVQYIKSDRDQASASKDGVTLPGQLRDTPVVILIDSGSASASEIFSGSLQNTGRAKLVGTSSYGKGSEQTTQEFSDGSALIYTLSNWTLPSGKVIDQNFPIKPDVEVLLGNDKSNTDDTQLNKAKELLK